MRFLLLVVPLLGIVSAIVTGCGGRADNYAQPDDGQGSYATYGYGAP